MDLSTTSTAATVIHTRTHKHTHTYRVPIITSSTFETDWIGENNIFPSFFLSLFLHSFLYLFVRLSGGQRDIKSPLHKVALPQQQKDLFHTFHLFLLSSLSLKSNHTLFVLALLFFTSLCRQFFFLTSAPKHNHSFFRTDMLEQSNILFFSIISNNLLCSTVQ